MRCHRLVEADTQEVEVPKLEEEEEVFDDDENANGVPALIHSRSATSDTFSSLPPTPQVSQFVAPPFAAKGKDTAAFATVDAEPRVIGKKRYEVEEVQEGVSVAV